VTVAQDILASTGVDINLCYQCRKCTSSCPVAHYYDLLPHQIMRYLQMDQIDVVLRSRMIWQCAECEACAERCPQGIEIVRVMDYLRIRAQKEGIPAAVPSVPLFYRAALTGISLLGRIYELGLMAQMYLALALRGELNWRQLFALDMPVGVRMLRKGKLPLVPTVSRGAKTQPPLNQNSIPYYPGCSLHGTSHEYHKSLNAIFRALGRPLQEPEGWQCCGTTPAHSTDEALAVVQPFYTVKALQDMGASFVTVPCPSCYQRLRFAQDSVAKSPHLADMVSAKTGADPAMPLDVEHSLFTVSRRLGLDAVRAAVRTPLHGLRVVCYYGCAITRPSAMTGADNVEDPQDMELLVQAAGCKTLDWSHKTECCGVSHSITQLPLALDLTEQILRDAKDVGADAIVVACPLCHTNLDTRQDNIARTFGLRYNVPVLYFSQVLGLAFGLSPDELGLGSHFVEVQPLLERAATLQHDALP